MWANTVWGLAGSAFTCFMVRLTMSDATIRTWLTVGAIFLGVSSLVTLIWPFVRSWYVGRSKAGAPTSFENESPRTAALRQQWQRVGETETKKLWLSPNPGEVATDTVHSHTNRVLDAFLRRQKENHANWWRWLVKWCRKRISNV
jgi:hypothetical protein